MDRNTAEIICSSNYWPRLSTWSWSMWFMLKNSCSLEMHWLSWKPCSLSGLLPEGSQKPAFSLDWFWTGTHYERDWLSNLRVIIHLGHYGSPCPLQEPVTLVGELWPCVKDWNIYDSPSGLADTPQDCTLRNVAHNNGIHKVWIWTCSCMDGCEEYQYLELGLYLTSYTWIETLFIFDLLQNCCLDNLDSKASVYHLWSKLRRLTCPFFSNSVLASNVPFMWKMCISNQRSNFHRIGIRNHFIFSSNGEI